MSKTITIKDKTGKELEKLIIDESVKITGVFKMGDSSYMVILEGTR